MSLFKKIELSDKNWITDCINISQYKNCEFSFANNFIWRETSNLMVANIEGFYVMRGKMENGYFYSFPVGCGDIKKAMDILKADAFSLNSKLTFKFIPQDALPILLENFPDEFEVEEDRDKFDYIYLSDKMITLSGKKLHAKRNHINAFTRDNSWSYEPISADNLAECEAMSEKWCKLYGCSNNLSLTHETCAVKNALAYFSELDLQGGLLRKDGEVIAFTIGEPLTNDTFVIHIEKAFHEIRGAYPMINQQFATHNCKDYKYINREEDTGDEGLRKAKLSYYPEILYKKYSAVLK